MHIFRLHQTARNLKRSRSRICFLIALVSQGIFGLLLTFFSLIGACLSRTDKKFFPCFPHPVNAEVNTRFPLNNDFKPTNDSTKFVDDSSIFEVVLQNARSKLDQTLSKTSEWVTHCGLVAGQFAERHFAERYFAERHFAERTF